MASSTWIKQQPLEGGSEPLLRCEAPKALFPALLTECINILNQWSLGYRMTLELGIKSEFSSLMSHASVCRSYIPQWSVVVKAKAPWLLWKAQFENSLNNPQLLKCILQVKVIHLAILYKVWLWISQCNLEHLTLWWLFSFYTSVQLPFSWR